MAESESRQLHTGRFLFLLCWIIYFVSYLGRKNLSAAMSSMITTGLLSRSDAGAINTAFFISYAAGQWINGLLADRLCPKRMVLIGICLACCSNAAMAIAQTPWLMLILWAINGYAMAMLWPPIFRIFTVFLSPERCMRSAVQIATAPVAGSVVACLVYALLLAWSGWRAPFLFAAGSLAICVFFWKFGFDRIEKQLAPQENAIEGTARSMPRSLLPLTALALLPLILPVLIQGMLRDGVNSWVPTYLSETFLISPDFSVALSVLLPLVNLCSPYVAHFAYRKIRRNEWLSSALFFAITTLFLFIFLWSKHVSVWLAVCLFALISTCMEATNILLVTIFPLRFSHAGKSASVSGFMNFLTYVGSAIAAGGIGLLADQSGWSTSLLVWCALAFIGFILCFFLRKNQAGSENEDYGT